MTETENKSVQTVKNDSNKRHAMLLIILLLIALIIILFLNLLKDNAPVLEREKLAEAGILPGMSTDEIQQRLDAIVEEGMFNASMNGVVHFANGNAEGDVNIENIDANHYACTVEVYLKNTDECVLRTGLIDPGSYVLTMPMLRPLVDGAFDCTAVFTAYDAETLQSVGKVNMDVVFLVGM